MVGESGGSAERKAAELRAGGKRSAGAWAAGAEGERRVAEALTQLPPDWLVLHDRLLMPGLAESNLDHLLVGPAGVILIDAKNWAGQIGEWEGSVFQHKWRAGGQRVHRPVDHEFAGVHAMATEVARRINHGVTVVICLAGRTADQFGEPRVVQDVWVVPVSRLVEWLAGRPHVDTEQIDRLKVLVRTEFPSTTTDAGLLNAIGRDLATSRATHSSTRIARQRRPRARSTSAPRRRGPVAPRRAPRGQRSGGARLLLSIAAVIAMVVGLQAGVLSSVTDAVGSGVANVLSHQTISGSSGETEELFAEGPVVRPDLLSCSSLRPAQFKKFADLKLVPEATGAGCTWSAVPKHGKQGRTVVIVRIHEDTDTFGAIAPLYKRSGEMKAPVVSKVYAIGGWTTTTWVTKGVALRVGKKRLRTQRYTHVVIAREALALTERQGNALALAVLGKVSTLPVSKSG
jgi:hypothetical protein